MKNFVICFIFVFMADLCFSYDQWNSKDRSLEAEQIQYWENKLEESNGMKGSEKLDYLRLGLVNIGRRTASEGRSQEIDGLFKSIRDQMISVSGHAQYFADRMEEARAKYSPDQIARDLAADYSWRAVDFRGLIYLKSPETISVLGNYLNDPRVDLMGGRNDPRYHDVRPTFAAMAAEMLREMEIREFPVKKYGEHFAEDPLAPVKYLMAPIEKSRVWWDEVKSGKRALSFIGEDVEYRFKPDGSWEKFPYTGPPDPPKVKEESKVKWDSEISKPVPVKQDWKKHWPWLAGAVALLVAVVVWFRRTARTV